MKKLDIGCALLLSLAPLHAQKTRLGQMPYAKPGVAYPVSVHTYAIHVRPDCEAGYCTNVVFADVVSQGRKLELRCENDVVEKPYKGVPLSLGDLRARVLKSGSGLEFGDEYELLLPNKRVMGCVVAGLME